MSKIYNPSITLKYNLKTGRVNKKGMYHNVVQKGNVASKYVYALQQHASVNYVFRAKPASTITFGDEIVKFSNNTGAGGHTQTWEYANAEATNPAKKGSWFIGTKGKKSDTDGYYWDTQIARVKIPSKASYTSNTEMARLSHLNLAGGFGLAGKDLKRSEVAVSPNYQYFLVANIDQDNNGYFTVYNLDDVNTALNNHGTDPCNINTLTPIKDEKHKPFKISKMATKGVIGSIQGYDIDDNLNIYISSESAPVHKQSASASETRHIYKIGWGETDSYQWDDIDLDANTVINYGNHPTEFESVQVISENRVYLTVAYHGTLSNGTWGTVANRIYEISWA